MTKLPAGRFKQVKAGQWVQPRMRSYFMKCCGCGLIHRMNFKVRLDSKGVARVIFQAFRAKKAWR